MTVFRQPINPIPILTGLLALCIGSLVYIVDRPPEHTFLIAGCMPGITLHHSLPNLFGPLGNSLADFAHVFAFIMITAGILSCTGKGAILVSAFWFCVDSLFEIGQKFSRVATDFLPSWFDAVPILDRASCFFRTGTFDWLDLAAIFMGAVSACLTLRIMGARTGSQSEKSSGLLIPSSTT